MVFYQSDLPATVEKWLSHYESAVGKLFGDSKLQAEVAGRRASGQLAQAYGDAMDSVAAFVEEKPVAAVAIGGIALLILDRLFRR